MHFIIESRSIGQSIATKKSEIAERYIKNQNRFQEITVGLFWRLSVDRAGRPASHMAKEPLASVDRSGRPLAKQKQILNCRSTGPVDRQNPRLRVLQSVGRSVDRKVCQSTGPVDWQTCTPKATRPDRPDCRPIWPEIDPVDRPVDR